MALKGNLKLLTMDGDQTLYADGKDFNDADLAALIIKLLRFGVTVAVVTAAGYPAKPGRYEQRLSGLLRAFKATELSAEMAQRFWVMGGECNFLFQCEPDYTLRALGPEEYQLYVFFSAHSVILLHARPRGIISHTGDELLGHPQGKSQGLVERPDSGRIQCAIPGSQAICKRIVDTCCADAARCCTVVVKRGDFSHATSCEAVPQANGCGNCSQPP